MKTVKILFICLAATIFVSAQNTNPLPITEVVVSPPEFTAVKKVEGQNTLKHYISKNFDPTAIKGEDREGTGVVQFVVNPSGKLSDYKVINSVSRAFDQEIIRIIKTTDYMWTPGNNNGSPVAMEKEVAIAFKTGVSNAAALNKDFTRISQKYFTKGATKLFVEGKSKNALKQFETAKRYTPYDESLLFMLAICNMELGNKAEAFAHLHRIKKTGAIKTLIPEHFAHYTKDLKSYKEVVEKLASK